MMKSKDRCNRCGVLLDKSWMQRAHRCYGARDFRGLKIDRSFIKKFVITEMILISSVIALFML